MPLTFNDSPPLPYVGFMLNRPTGSNSSSARETTNPGILNFAASGILINRGLFIAHADDGYVAHLAPATAMAMLAILIALGRGLTQVTRTVHEPIMSKIISSC